MDKGNQLENRCLFKMIKMKWGIQATDNEPRVVNTCGLDVTLVLLYYAMQYLEK